MPALADSTRGLMRQIAPSISEMFGEIWFADEGAGRARHGQSDRRCGLLGVSTLKVTAPALDHPVTAQALEALQSHPQPLQIDRPVVLAQIGRGTDRWRGGG